LDDLPRGLDARLVNVVHDEIVLEVSEQDAAEAKARLEAAMRAGMLEIFPDAMTVGLVDAKIVPNWGGAK
jgi:DNA polymerase-1